MPAIASQKPMNSSNTATAGAASTSMNIDITAIAAISMTNNSTNPMTAITPATAIRVQSPTRSRNVCSNSVPIASHAECTLELFRRTQIR